MNAPEARSGGVSGRSEALPDQGAQLARPPQAGETVEQSCPTDSSGHSTQFRIRLPAKHAARWLALPPRLREHVAGVIFGSYTSSVDLQGLPTVASELRETRASIINVLQLALQRNAPLDVHRVHAVLDRINSLLGES